MKDNVVYKIMNSNRLYSSGGTSPNFNREGKVWTSLGRLKSHLRQFPPRSIPKDWIIVEFSPNGKQFSASGVFGNDSY